MAHYILFFTMSKLLPSVRFKKCLLLLGNNIDFIQSPYYTTAYLTTNYKIHLKYKGKVVSINLKGIAQKLQ